jgi:hypothetical protein
LQHKPSRPKIIASVLVYISLLVGLGVFLTAANGAGRASQVSLLSIPGGTQEVKQLTDEDGTQNPLLSRFYHNKLYFYSRFFFTFYSQHVSPDFLFINSGLPVRYRMIDIGNLYLIEAPFLLLGFIVLVDEGTKEMKYTYLIPIAWLLIGVIPAALTWEYLPNVVRANLMIPGLMIITAFGFFEALQMIKGYIRTVFILIVVIFLCQNIALFLHNYFYHSKIHEPWFRSAGEPDLIYSINALNKNGQKFVMTTQNNNNLLFYLFYNAFDPRTFQKMGSPREKDGLHFNNFVYSYNPCPIQGDPKLLAEGDIGTIFVDKPDCSLPKNAEIIKTIRTPDGLPAFLIVTLLPLKE